MKPTSRLFSFLLIILLLFGTVPVVHAQPDCTPITAGTSIEDVNTPVISCADPPICFSGSILEAKDPYQVDYYKITLGAGQKLIIDVDARTNDSTLDALLEVLETDGTTFLFNNDQMDKDGKIISLDPYLEFFAPPDGDVTYFIAISADSADPTDPSDISNSGTYTFSLQCSDQTGSPEFKWPVDVGDLLGATGSDTGSLINITPENAGSSLPFPLGISPIMDVEYDPSSILIFVAVDAVDNIPARIVAIDPNSGNEVASYSLEAESVVALEAAENKLYGVRVDSLGANFTLVEVTFDIDLKTVILTDVVSLGQFVVRALAYNKSEKVMYGASGTDLVRIDLASSPVEIQEVMLSGLSSEIVTLDFSHEDILYGVDRDGNLFNVPIFSNREAVVIGEPTDGVSSLTFVIEEAGQDEDPPIKTICSSSFTNQTAASSESGNNRLERFKRERNPRNSAIGLYKFEGEIGETLQLSVCLEEQGAVESEEASKSSWIEKLWPQWKPKNRVFVVIRDAIPEVDFREKKKAVLTQDEPTLDITDVQLPATGLYYIMVIRPFHRFHNFDYCLSLESDGTAGDSLVVAWPNDEKEESPTSTSAQVKTTEVQSDQGTDEVTSDSVESKGTDKSTETLVVESKENNDPVPVTLSTSAIAPASVSAEGSPAASLMNPEGEEDDREEVQTVEKTTGDESDEIVPEVVTAETVEDDGSAGDESGSDEDDPAAHITSEGDEEVLILKGAPPAI